LKITDIEAIVVRQPAIDATIADGSQDDLLVRIHTDAGLTGVGEVDSAPEAVRAFIEGADSHANAVSLRDMLIGEDPRDVEALWWKLYRGSIYFGRRGLGIHALSGIDIALWDLRGQAEGKPVCELLGTPMRDRVRAYASTLMPDTPEEVRETVGELRDAGFRAVKLGWGPLGRDPEHDVALAHAARDAGGDDMEVLIDAGLGYGGDARTAIGVAREFESLGVFWLEEPFAPDELEAYAELADTVDLRIAAGEHDVTMWGFRELIVKTVPHAWKSGIIKAASLHVNAVLPDAVFQEYCVSGTPINTALVREQLPLDADGCVAVPTEPGLGVTLDLEVVERYRVP
jgi:L-rhamnonate dehydratase